MTTTLQHPDIWASGCRSRKPPSLLPL